MLVRDVMSKNVISVASNTPIGDAQRIMKEHNFRRLPVIDNCRALGIITQDRLEKVKPRTSAPLLWQITYLVSHTKVSDVMRKNVVTVKPTDTIEKATAKAQSSRVGSLIVVEKGKVVGIMTTNDLFYRVLNPTLGIGEPGIRISVPGAGDGRSIEKVISCINQLGIDVRVVWAIRSPITGERDLTIQVDADDSPRVIQELEKLGCKAEEIAR